MHIATSNNLVRAIMWNVISLQSFAAVRPFSSHHHILLLVVVVVFSFAVFES